MPYKGISIRLSADYSVKKKKKKKAELIESRTVATRHQGFGGRNGKMLFKWYKFEVKDE